MLSSGSIIEQNFILLLGEMIKVYLVVAWAGIAYYPINALPPEQCYQVGRSCIAAIAPEGCLGLQSVILTS